VLQKGKIVERGTHDGLIKQNGFYKKLVDMQEVK
jgi:subfamily B ATP-binding cassette protein MsbA